MLKLKHSNEKRRKDCFTILSITTYKLGAIQAHQEKNLGECSALFHLTKSQDKDNPSS